MRKWIFLLLACMAVFFLTHGVAFSRDSGDSSKSSASKEMSVDERLQKIMSNQELIIAYLEAIKKELAIVKIRATR